MEYKTVKGKVISGQSRGSFFRDPLVNIGCGECGHTFAQRVPVVDRSKIPCPHCRTLNELPLKVVEYED